MSSDVCERPVRAPPVWQESFTRNILRICIARGKKLERRSSVADVEKLENLDVSGIHARRLNAKEIFEEW